MSARLSDYDYELPRELIAQRPPEHRDDSRLMVLRRDWQGIEHQQFDELKTFLQQGDLLVLNNTQVLPARRFSDNGAVEFLFLERLAPCRWKCLVSPGRKMHIGATVKLGNVSLCVDKITPEGERIVVLNKDIDLYSGGSMPLPPYIRRDSDIEDAARYQTVFAQAPGALAAPTAGLHFTSEILNGIPHTFSISPSAAGRINSAGRIVAVGTTVVRVLESAERTDGNLVPQEGSTDIFIYPPYQFRAVDVLVTNFHLPRSTLFMLVSAFAGREFLLRAYQEAIRERYRFYSYGDCMLIL